MRTPQEGGTGMPYSKTKITAGHVSVHKAKKRDPSAQPGQSYNCTFLNFSLNRHEFIQRVSNLLFSCLHLTL